MLGMTSEFCRQVFHNDRNYTPVTFCLPINRQTLPGIAPQTTKHGPRRAVTGICVDAVLASFAARSTGIPMPVLLTSALTPANQHSTRDTHNLPVARPALPSLDSKSHTALRLESPPGCARRRLEILPATPQRMGPHAIR